MSPKNILLLTGLLFVFCGSIKAQEKYQRNVTIPYIVSGHEEVYRKNYQIDGEILDTTAYREPSATAYEVFEIKEGTLNLYYIYQLNDSIAGLSIISVNIQEFLLTLDHPNSSAAQGEQMSYELSLYSQNGDVFDETWYVSTSEGLYKMEGGNRQVIRLKFGSSQQFEHVLDEVKKASAKK